MNNGVQFRLFLLSRCCMLLLLKERYLSSLMPLQRNISPHKSAPCLKPFDAEEFIKNLEHSGPQLTSVLKGDWVGLYR